MQHLATQGRTGFTRTQTALIRLGKVWHCSEIVLSSSGAGVEAAGTFFLSVNKFPGTKIFASREQ